MRRGDPDAALAISRTQRDRCGSDRFDRWLDFRKIGSPCNGKMAAAARPVKQFYTHETLQQLYPAGESGWTKRQASCGDPEAARVGGSNKSLCGFQRGHFAKHMVFQGSTAEEHNMLR